MKKIILYVFLVSFLPFIPVIFFIILLYKYFIIYLWLFLDIIFKDILRFRDYSIYNNIQKFFKYFFFEFFFEVLPLILLKYFKNLSPKYLFYFLIQLILKLQALFLRLIIFFISGLPTIFRKFKYIFFSLIKYIRYIFKRMNIYLFFYKHKLKKVLFMFVYIFFDFLVLLKFFLLYLYLYLLSFIKYFFVFDKIYLFVLNILKTNKYILIFDKTYENNFFYIKLLILFNKLISLNKKEIIYLLNNSISVVYILLNKLILIEIKNILLFNKYIKSNKIKFRILKLLKKNFWFCEYITIYWTLNKLLIKQNYLIYLFLKFLIIFKSSCKLIKYYVIKL